MLILSLILFPMLAAPALYVLGRREAALAPGAAVCAAAELALSALLLVRPRSLLIPGLILGGLSFETGGFRVCYSLLASVLWLGTSLFSRAYFRGEPAHLRSYWAFIFVTLGAVQGLFLSGDFMTAFFFFELLSLTSFPWVMHQRTASAIRSGCTYLAVSVFGGLVLFLGLLLLYAQAGTLTYRELPAALAAADPGRLRAAGVCILLGFGAKAGMFPLHIWLPKAHPVAPAPASALLSGMLTKAGVFGILMAALYVLPGDRMFGTLLLTLALITMALGAVLALFSVDLKRTLACSSMSQIGFILTGAASAVLCRASGSEEGAVLALSGAVLHMVNHSLLKQVLFLSAGAVAMNLHALDLNDIRGWGRNKPLLKLVFLAAALGISGVPGFCGYLSKTLLHEGLVEAVRFSGIWPGTEWIFLVSGGLTLAYMCKLYICLFHEKNADPAVQARFDLPGAYLPPPSSAVLLIAAALLLPWGHPKAALALSAFMTGTVPAHFAAFSLESLSGGGISLSLGMAVYLGFVRPVLRRSGIYRDLWPSWLDLEDALYRPLLLTWLPGVLSVPARLAGENLLLRPLCRGLVLMGSVAGRALDSGTDALLLALRKTVLRAAPSRDRAPAPPHPLRQALGTALSSVTDNFSSAMMLSCAGIVLVFALLLLFS